MVSSSIIKLLAVPLGFLELVRPKITPKGRQGQPTKKRRNSLESTCSTRGRLRAIITAARRLAAVARATSILHSIAEILRFQVTSDKTITYPFEARWIFMEGLDVNVTRQMNELVLSFTAL